MSKDTFLIHLIGRNPAYTNNTPSDFNCPLPRPITLDEDHEWYVTLLDLKLRKPFMGSAPSLFVCSDICEDSQVGTSLLPLLCHIGVKGQCFNSHLNIPVRVRKKTLHSIRIYITDDVVMPAPLKSPTGKAAGPLVREGSSCTLLFEKGPACLGTPRNNADRSSGF